MLNVKEKLVLKAVGRVMEKKAEKKKGLSFIVRRQKQFLAFASYFQEEKKSVV